MGVVGVLFRNDAAGGGDAEEGGGGLFCVSEKSGERAEPMSVVSSPSFLSFVMISQEDLHVLCAYVSLSSMDFGFRERSNHYCPLRLIIKVDSRFLSLSLFLYQQTPPPPTAYVFIVLESVFPFWNWRFKNLI